LYFSFTVKNNQQEKLCLGTLFQYVYYLVKVEIADAILQGGPGSRA